MSEKSEQLRAVGAGGATADRTRDGGFADLIRLATGSVHGQSHRDVGAPRDPVRDHEVTASAAGVQRAHGTRLTPWQVGVIKSRALAARAARAALVDSDRELAREFLCSIDTVRKIATGVRWNPDAPKRRHR